MIVSFLPDLEFLRYCLRSIQKFATGFAGVTVVVPDRDEEAFEFVEAYGATLKCFDEPAGKGFNAHQLQIIEADRYCPLADYLLFMDSDCVFWEPVKPENYFVDGKPIHLRERYDTLTNKVRLNWRTAVTAATGIEPEYEGMARLPALHIREVFQATRDRISTHTCKFHDQYILGCKNDFPQGFSEFNVLYAVAHEQFYDRYYWVEVNVTTADGGYEYRHGVDFMKAFWSHAGVDAYRAELDAICTPEFARLVPRRFRFTDEAKDLPDLGLL